MAEDHLDKETSVSAEITPTSVSAKAKSRTIAALDRFFGNIIDRANAPLESKTAEIRALSDARLRTIKLVEELGSKLLQNDPEIATRAIERHLDGALRRQVNKEAVVKAALNDLQNEPPSGEQSATGGEELDSGFMNRFERYAEDATDEQLREKWGRVLASEIRTPGTFSSKVMRIVDELDASTAQLFERTCKHRLSNVIIKSISGELAYSDTARLVNAGLIFDPGFMGTLRKFSETTDEHGNEFWAIDFGLALVAVPKGLSIPSGIDPVPIKWTSNNNVPGVPIYALTDVGQAVATILPNVEETALKDYLDRLATYLSPTQVLHLRGDGKMASLVDSRHFSENKMTVQLSPFAQSMGYNEVR